MEVVALIRRVSTSRLKMGDQFLEQRINIKFCEKLGKNASDTCAVFSEAYGRQTVKKIKWFDCISGSKTARV
jgi:hypothetical protein